MKSRITGSQTHLNSDQERWEACKGLPHKVLLPFPESPNRLSPPSPPSHPPAHPPSFVPCLQLPCLPFQQPLLKENDGPFVWRKLRWAHLHWGATCTPPPPHYIIFPLSQLLLVSLPFPASFSPTHQSAFYLPHLIYLVYLHAVFLHKGDSKQVTTTSFPPFCLRNNSGNFGWECVTGPWSPSGFQLAPTETCSDPQSCLGQWPIKTFP